MAKNALLTRSALVLVCAILCLALIHTASAVINTQSMTLLAVSEDINGSTGSTATATLQLVPGTGQVYISTYPFAKIDTQVSVRLAKEVACDFLGTRANCDKYDFIYTIETGSTTIGGPSAGAAIAALTVASLDNVRIDPHVAMSGTINSGGVIGAVGGLKEKIDAAAQQGIKTVLIPLGERQILDRPDLAQTTEGSDNITGTTTQPDSSSDSSSDNPDAAGNATNPLQNITQNISRIIVVTPLPSKIDLVDYGRTKGVTVAEVGALEDAMPYLTGVSYSTPATNLTLPDFYTTQMRKVQEQLCARAQNMLDTLHVPVSYTVNSSSGRTGPIIVTGATQFVNETLVLDNSNIDIAQTLQSARDLLNQSKAALGNKEYYSSASYCYGAALNLRLLSLLNTTPAMAQQQAAAALADADVNLTNYRTITDLQTYMLVDERLTEARDRIDSANKLVVANESVLALNDYATAIERAYSAKLWSSFFSTGGNKITLDMGALDDSCRLKIQEAAERQNLIGYYTNDANIGGDLLDQAQAQLGKNPVLCLFAASKAKATYDVVLSTLGLTPDVFNQTFAKKAQIASQVMSSEFSKGAFPLIGYSYYEYAKSLAPTDPSASMLYIQYALELSNLDAYLSPQQEAAAVGRQASGVSASMLSSNEIMLLGISIGLVLGVVLVKLENLVKQKKQEQKNRYPLRKRY